jgi:hypothetical protein
MTQFAFVAMTMLVLTTALGCTGPQQVQPMDVTYGFGDSTAWFFNVGNSGVSLNYLWQTTNDPIPSSADVNSASLTFGQCTAQWQESTQPGDVQIVPLDPTSTVSVAIAYPAYDAANCSSVSLKIVDSSPGQSAMPWGLLRGCNFTVSNWTDASTGDGYNGYKATLALTRNITVVSGQLSVVRHMTSYQEFSLSFATSISVQIAVAVTNGSQAYITPASKSAVALSNDDNNVNAALTSDASSGMTWGWTEWFKLQTGHLTDRSVLWLREVQTTLAGFVKPYKFRLFYRIVNPDCPDLFVRTHREPLQRHSPDHLALRACLRDVVDVTINSTIVIDSQSDHSEADERTTQPIYAVGQTMNDAWDNIYVGQIFHWKYALDNSTGCLPLIDKAPDIVYGSRDHAALRQCMYDFMEFKISERIDEP